MKCFNSFIIIITCVWLTGCEPISDPWVTDDEQYAEERARTDSERRIMIDRAQRGQRDR